MTETILTAGPEKVYVKRYYTILAQGFHWLTALLIFSILPIAWIMVLLPKTDPSRDTWYTTHKSLGIAILALTVLRILWRAIKTPPPLPGRAAAWERLFSKITHWLLYLLLFAMPISGYLFSAAGNHQISIFGLFDLPLIPENKQLSETAEQAHLSLQWLVYALIVLHLAGTGWHVFLRRMVCSNVCCRGRSMPIKFLAVWTIFVLLVVCGSFPSHADPALERVYEILAHKRYVDLTHSFSPTTPVWSGFGQAKMRPAENPETHVPYSIPQDGFRATVYEMVGQYGTHIDPPAHFSETGVTLDQIPVKDMILRLVVFDETPLLKNEPNHAFSLADLQAWEKQHGQVPAGAFAALRTDLSKDWIKDPEHFKRSPFPAWALETVKFLVEQRRVTAIGHEALDTDVTDKMESETYILSSGHFQIEAMANLDQVPATGALIVVSWPKAENGLGFPARAFAILP